MAATASHRAPQRAWMRRALQQIPAPGRDALRRGLEDERRFETAYHELCVAAILQRAQLSPRYELQLAGVTPDLFVDAEPPRRSAVVEIWTKSRRADSKAETRSWDVLRGLVHQIPRPIGIAVVANGGLPVRPPNSRASKQIARELRQWLLLASTRPGSQLDTNGYRFVALAEAPGLRAALGPPAAGGVVDSATLLEGIRVKALKYSPVARELQAQLIVIVAVERGAPGSLDQLRSGLCGRNTVEMSFSPFQAGPIGSWSARLAPDERAWEWPPELSGIGWLAAGVNTPGRLMLITNPNLTDPIAVPTAPDGYVTLMT
ncbi:MAG: hypothetical protein QOI95_2917 [Acidimicrobiaceae bacterium]